jgi:biopolymer transport protein ExbD
MAMVPAGQAQINVTPMIDILLVLFILFMVITPLAPTGLKAVVPQPAPPGAQPAADASDIVITVRSDGSIRLNQESVEPANLSERLARLYHGVDRPIFVRGEKGLEFRHVAAVIDIAHGAGLNRVALMTE